MMKLSAVRSCRFIEASREFQITAADEGGKDIQLMMKSQRKVAFLFPSALGGAELKKIADQIIDALTRATRRQ